MLTRLKCLGRSHLWSPVLLPGGRASVQRCQRCHAVETGPDGKVVFYYVPRPLRATRRRIARTLDKLAKRNAKDDAMIAQTEREAEELLRELG
jgi:hypothetical protein